MIYFFRIYWDFFTWPCVFCDRERVTGTWEECRFYCWVGWSGLFHLLAPNLQCYHRLPLSLYPSVWTLCLPSEKVDYYWFDGQLPFHVYGCSLCIFQCFVLGVGFYDCYCKLAPQPGWNAISSDHAGMSVLALPWFSFTQTLFSTSSPPAGGASSWSKLPSCTRSMVRLLGHWFDLCLFDRCSHQPFCLLSDGGFYPSYS